MWQRTVPLGGTVEVDTVVVVVAEVEVDWIVVLAVVVVIVVIVVEVVDIPTREEREANRLLKKFIIH